VARTDDSAPGVDEAMFDEPLEPVLTASWSLEEEGLDLVPVEVAVAVQRLQDRDVSFRKPDYSTSGGVSCSESKFQVGIWGLGQVIERGPSRRPIRLI
jgi:hypothetical protein